MTKKGERVNKWNPALDDVLREKYADTLNSELVKELGYSLRTIERHAAALGIKKSAEFMRKTQINGLIEAERWYDYMRITGQKIVRAYSSGRRFKKGEKLPPEIEKKRVEAIRRRAWDDRVRIIHGMRPKAKWKYDLTAYDKFKKEDK